MAFTASLLAQNPHGENFKIDCASCHSPAGWDIPESHWDKVELVKPRISETTGMPLPVDTSLFRHSKTDFPLEGQHRGVDCRACHENLVFGDAETTCASCHTDVHQNSLGADCARCHSPENWLVNNITDLHAQGGFPLLGAHATANCFDCHISESMLRFEPIGNDCIHCHQTDYASTTNPDHQSAGFSTSCIDCHDPKLLDWSTEIVDHSFFPLTKGHDIADCASCHSGGDFSNISNECFACHQADFTATEQPDHEVANFMTDCASCHTTDPGWMPAEYLAHDSEFFPIYSGAHDGTWNECQECHTELGNFDVFSCIVCHINPETDEAHEGIAGYNYESGACLACHPTGSSDESFDHNSTAFPLTGAHLDVDCIQCHSEGYAGTPTECSACHSNDFQQTLNPNHVALGIPTDCASCHTTEPEWMPASFDIHNDYYALNGAHAVIANDCAACHNGDYNNTPNTCFGCHAEDFNNTTNPSHITAQFTTDCATCHSESAWEPSTFDHDAQYFPIYSGEHDGEWSECIDCHTNPANYAIVTCTNCHMNPETDEEHEGVGGYVFESSACIACHPTGDADDVFDHNLTAFPLTGAHQTANCLDCHSAGYAGTPTDCASCHQTDYDLAANPNHTALGLPLDCASCHTTQPDWAPASFDIHNDYYALNGAHAAIANDCAACHNGDYINTPNTCNGCHAADFTATTDPNHQELQFPTDCASCHTESAWEPATFDHDAFFPFTGAHIPIAEDCNACHNGNYTNTPNTCAGCHTQDFNQSANPNHSSLGLPMDCASCHTTQPDWMPATFDIHNDYYVLNGAHAAIANDCAACHNGDYNNTPNTCFGCHAEDYNQTSNPNHVAAQFSTDCATCHSENNWVPSTFDHDAQYFPIHSGAHNGEWDQCTDCHTNPSNYPEVNCLNCHMNPETDEFHEGVNGYSFNNSSCLACHPTGSADDNFDHNNTAFPLTGAHLSVECIDCHTAGYAGTPTECSACHTSDFNGATNPNHVAIGLSMDCASCHTTDPGWTPATFANHDDVYPLTGAHALISNDCAVCHQGDYSNTPNTCAGCHTTDYNASENPNHTALGIPMQCDMCHTTQPDWMPATFDIHNEYYALNGAHAAIANDCAACHNGDYNSTPNTCVGCHQSDFNATTNPDHVSAGFPTDCASCHAESAWSPANFDHDIIYPLNGAHQVIENDCAACHSGGFDNTPNTCVGCHQADFNATTNPDHVSAGFPTDCASCHTESAWSPANFDHDIIYPLNGAHQVIENDCAACHSGGFDNTPNTCVGCHQADFNATTNPDHVSAGFPTDCASCHTESAWSPANFDHNIIYPLNGAHQVIENDCAACHSGGFDNTPNTCVGCHQSDFNATTNPDHVSAGFPTDCASCHTESAWSPANYDHDIFYPLNGAHQVIENDCAACHSGGFDNTPNTCVGCHQADFDGTTNPDHASAGFPTDCATCHNESAWEPSSFDHDAFFPFTGAHIPIANDCVACHSGGFNNTPNTCAGCHTPDYNSSTNPNHTNLGLPTDCASCHTTNPDWMPASFDIHNDYYVLNGAHAAIANDCASCHNGDYNNTPNTCLGCHQADYDATINPNHASAGFPTDCASCHSETAWTPATFDHDQIYPLNGAHEIIENDCAACHSGGFDNTPNTCVGCHQADYNATTSPNHTNAGFPTDCASCHSESAWMPATFDHDQIYPLNGAHEVIANDCNACHSGGFENTPNTCFGCHASDYNNANNPNHSAAGFPTDCASCHSESAWEPANFDHDDMYFPIYDGKHEDEWNDCVDCHIGGNFSSFSCIDCHEHDDPGDLADEHDEVSAYTYSSPACYSCHPTGED